LGLGLGLGFFYHGLGPSTNSIESPPTCQIGPITRAMAKKLQEDWNTATDGFHI